MEWNGTWLYHMRFKRKGTYKGPTKTPPKVRELQKGSVELAPSSRRSLRQALEWILKHEATLNHTECDQMVEQI